MPPMSVLACGLGCTKAEILRETEAFLADLAERCEA